jgi:hypothetical protein
MGRRAPLQSGNVEEVRSFEFKSSTRFAFYVLSRMEIDIICAERAFRVIKASLLRQNLLCPLFFFLGYVRVRITKMKIQI